MNDKNVNLQSYKEQIGNLVLLAINHELIETGYANTYNIHDYLKQYKGSPEELALTMIFMASNFYKSYDDTIEKLEIEMNQP